MSLTAATAKPPFAVRPESPNGTMLPWPKVQRRIAQLIKEDRFYTEAEQDRFDSIDPIAIREALAERGIVNGQVVDPEKLDKRPVYPTGDAGCGGCFRPGNAPRRSRLRRTYPASPLPREGDTLTIGSGEPTHEMDIAVSDGEYEAIRQAIPETEAPTASDPATPPYHVGDTVYLDNQEYQITELREDTVQLLPSDMAYPIYRVESRERFETLLRADTRNEAINEFLPVNPDTADQDLRDVLVHGLIGAPDKAELSELLHTGKPNREIAQWLGRAFPGIVETMELETGDTADYRTTSEGIELEVLDADEKRLAMLYFRWDEVAPLMRGLYARQLDGFGREQAEPAITADTTVEEPSKPSPLRNLPRHRRSTPSRWPSTPANRTICPMTWWWSGCTLTSRNPRRPNRRRTRSRRKSRTTRLPSRSTASGRLSPTRLPSRRPIRSTGTTCAATPRTSISPTTIWARAAPRPSTRPMWRRSSC